MFGISQLKKILVKLNTTLTKAVQGSDWTRKTDR